VIAELNPPAIRYIKLGSGGAFASEAFERGVIPLGFREADHKLCDRGDWTKLKADLINAGRNTSAASQDIRELRDFYELPAGSLWVTMARGHLWWA